MKLGIIDADLIDGGTRHPNLALMKVSSYYKSKGWKVELLLDYKNLDNYNKIVISKVFTFTKVSPNIFKDGVLHEEQPEKYLKDNIEIGGTGFYFDKAPNLPDEIEHIMPDYHYTMNLLQVSLKQNMMIISIIRLDSLQEDVSESVDFV